MKQSLISAIEKKHVESIIPIVYQVEDISEDNNEDNQLIELIDAECIAVYRKALFS